MKDKVESRCSEGPVDARVKSVVGCVEDVDGEEVFSLVTEPPVVAEAEAVVSNLGQRSLDAVG